MATETTAARPARRHRGIMAVMWTGLALTAVAAVYPFLDSATTQLLADHIRAGYPTYSRTRIDAAVTTYLVLSSVVGTLGVLAWLSTIWVVRAGKRWARPAATVMFVLAVSVALTGLLTRDTSGATGLPPALGWAGTVPCLAGILTLVLLWRRPRPA